LPSVKRKWRVLVDRLVTLLREFGLGEVDARNLAHQIVSMLAHEIVNDKR
jgi:uracil phosphoribosyltransferase